MVFVASCRKGSDVWVASEVESDVLNTCSRCENSSSSATSHSNVTALQFNFGLLKLIQYLFHNYRTYQLIRQMSYQAAGVELFVWHCARQKTSNIVIVVA